MTAPEHADAIRAGAKALRDLIAAAQADHVEVRPPFTLQVYLVGGNEKHGGPSDWTFVPHM